MGMERHVKLFKNGRNQAVRIPRNSSLRGKTRSCERKAHKKLIIESAPKKILPLDLAHEWEPIERTFQRSKTCRPSRFDL